MSCLVEISNTVSGGCNALNTKSWSYKQLRWGGLQCKTHKKKTEEGINKEKVISVTAVSFVLKKIAILGTRALQQQEQLKQSKDVKITQQMITSEL